MIRVLDAVVYPCARTMPPLSPEAETIPVHESDMRDSKCAVTGMEEVVDPRYRIQTDPLGPDGLRIAEEELRETPERVQEALDQLRELLRGKFLIILSTHKNTEK